MAGIPVALTMYTLREEAARDYMGASRQALEMGYAGLQTHYRACDPAQLRELAGDFGARVCGMHVSIDPLRSEPDAVADATMSPARTCRRSSGGRRGSAGPPKR